ncbi:GntR family transcriptional regulator [Actinomadura rayongensis]|uniref:GntR family transcriptional regulator n=1 Tax=Actinomadura rayongensis TaxID=1429076 RepID=A0A6I4WBL2_9ACTN|nr:GntR family transcriptional regulator [Actinomadura rayongensis]MXQ64434.1 GntR family transcriptional regulator [Actinomadura rayongensis]
MAVGGVVEEVTERIAFQIASGRLKAGDGLPSIRKLAAEHGVTLSRIQQVIERLTAAGFVEPRHGVGVIVRDIRLYGGVETWRYLFRFSGTLPDLTVENVREILEHLHLFYQVSFRRLADSPAAVDPAPARRALHQLELLARTEPVRAADVHQGVLQILRTVHASLGGRITLGLLNTMGAMLGEVPDVLEALYADPAEHVWFWNEIVTSWETRDPDRARAALDVLDDWHGRALQRLRDRLAAASARPS